VTLRRPQQDRERAARATRSACVITRARDGMTALVRVAPRKHAASPDVTIA